MKKLIGLIAIFAILGWIFESSEMKGAAAGCICGIIIGWFFGSAEAHKSDADLIEK